MTGIRTLADFRERCKVDPRTQCWQWLGTTEKSGRPSIWLSDLGRRLTPGGAICYLTTGELPGWSRPWVRTCRTPNCCARAHRSPDGKRQGAPLSELKRRQVGAMFSRYSDETVAAIRADSGRLVDIAARHGVSYSTAGKYRRGELRVEPATSPFAGLVRASR